jgi:hypothetical protein
LAPGFGHLNDAGLVVDFDAELFVAKVQILQLLPLEHPDWKKSNENESAIFL